MQQIKVLITVKTYPIPSSKYDELVCTAGVTETGDFIRLYPINFCDLPFGQQYQKYQWMEINVEKHQGRDVRKESYRPECSTIRLLGEPIRTRRSDWSERARFVLKKAAHSMEDLYEQQQADRTSLGVFRPKVIRDLVISQDEGDWKPGFKAALAQARLWDDRKVTKEPPRKVPYKFHYVFECDDTRCRRNHKMMIEDWEVGALYWRLVDQGKAPDVAAAGVKDKFLGEICGADRDTHFYVGTILAYPKSWVVIGAFWPRRAKETATVVQPRMFDLDDMVRYEGSGQAIS